MSDKTPHITVTMIGGSNSGKTTYMHGMYMTLSAGVEDYFLYAPRSMDQAIENTWRELVETGKMPLLNASGLIPYEFTFNDGLDPLVTIDWVDYRGGSWFDDDKDARQLEKRLKVTDSIYMVIDSSFLTEKVKGSTAFQGVGTDTRTRMANGVIAEALRNRRKAPSIVVLLTKFDMLLEGRFDRNDQEGSYASLCEDVRELLGIAFQKPAGGDDLFTLVCPVLLGKFGEARAQQVDPKHISPMWLQRPMLFSLMHFLRSRAKAHAQKGAEHEAGSKTAKTNLDNLQDQFWARNFEKHRLEAARAGMNEADREAKVARALEKADGDRVSRILTSELNDMFSLMFINGEPMGGKLALP